MEYNFFETDVVYDDEWEETREEYVEACEFVKYVTTCVLPLPINSSPQ